MLLPRAALAAAAALALAACGASTDAQSDPSMTMPSSLGAGSSTPTAPTSPSSPTTSAAPTTPATSPATSSAPASPSNRPTTVAGKVLDFQGIHLLLPVEHSDLPGIPDGLRSALAAGLKKRWDAYGDAPGCEKGPVYVVNKVDTAGWASIDTWDDPGVSGPKCAGVGGGYAGFWAVVDGTWKEVIGTQELAACATLQKYHFPVSIVGDKCSTPDGSEVAYRG